MHLLCRFVLIVAAVGLFSGCSGSDRAADMESRNPYWLTFDGSEREAHDLLRRRLSFDGWSILRSERGMISAQKVLSPDEMASSKVVTGGMVGGGAGGQEGRVTLSIDNDGDDTWISLEGVFANEGAPTNQASVTRPMKRKHPLMIKMGLRLHSLSGFELTEPPPSALRQWARRMRR